MVPVLGLSPIFHSIITAIRKIDKTGNHTTDCRGKYIRDCSITGVQLERVRNHVQMMILVSSQFPWAKSPHWHYIDTELFINRLYQMYLDWMFCEHPKDPTVEPNFYRKLYSAELNFSFEFEKCSECDILQDAIDNAEEESNEVEKRELMVKLEEHRSKAPDVQQAMKQYAKIDHYQKGN